MRHLGDITLDVKMSLTLFIVTRAFNIPLNYLIRAGSFPTLMRR